MLARRRAMAEGEEEEEEKAARPKSRVCLCMVLVTGWSLHVLATCALVSFELFSGGGPFRAKVFVQSDFEIFLFAPLFFTGLDQQAVQARA